MLILLTVCHTFDIFYLSLTDFQNFPGPEALFQDFPVLENVTIKFQDFPGFPGPIRTLPSIKFTQCPIVYLRGEMNSQTFLPQPPKMSSLVVTHRRWSLTRA